MQPHSQINLGSAKAFLVGGHVRDQLLGIPKGDRDWVVVGANPKQMKAQGFIQVGKDFPVFLHPISHEEYALARKEIKTGHGYHGFDCEIDNVSLVEDLKRRDITINAMALEVNDQGEPQLIDPFGGRQDLENKIIRHTSTAFAEDPLRLIRVARFLAKLHHLGFKVHPETKNLLIQMVELGEINQLTKERVWLEVEKALKTQSPEVFFTFLNEVGALNLLFPGYAPAFNETWFQNLKSINKSYLPSLVKLGLCFYGYPAKEEIGKWYRLSKRQEKLLNLLSIHNPSFQLHANKTDLEQDESFIDWLCALFLHAGVMKDEPILDELMLVWMSMHDMDLSSPFIQKIVTALYAYLNSDVASLFNHKSKPKNPNQAIEQFKRTEVKKALQAK